MGLISRVSSRTYRKCKMASLTSDAQQSQSHDNHHQSSSTTSPPKNDNSSTAADDQKPETPVFQCNICLDTAREAVVSQCGHLFCWPCLHRWLETRPDRNECPVCKSHVTKEKCTPIYGHGTENAKDPRDQVPPRPQGRQERSQANNNPFNGMFGDIFGNGFGGNGMMGGGIGGSNISFSLFPFGLFGASFNFGGG